MTDEKNYLELEKVAQRLRSLKLRTAGDPWNKDVKNALEDVTKAIQQLKEKIDKGSDPDAIYRLFGDQ
jgi:hypothetical protein